MLRIPSTTRTETCVYCNFGAMYSGWNVKRTLCHTPRHPDTYIDDSNNKNISIWLSCLSGGSKIIYPPPIDTNLATNASNTHQCRPTTNYVLPSIQHVVLCRVRLACNHCPCCSRQTKNDELAARMPAFSLSLAVTPAFSLAVMPAFSLV